MEIRLNLFLGGIFTTDITFEVVTKRVEPTCALVKSMKHGMNESRYAYC